MIGVQKVLALCVALVALVAGAWLLPYRFPPSAFVAGASFEVGFNNQVSYVWYLAFLIVPSVILARMLPKRVVQQRSTVSQPRSGSVSWVIGGVVLLHVVLFGAIYGYKRRFVFSEAIYFQTLVYRMTLGEVPYLDFSYYYGPSMLYPAYWLTGIMSLEAAYALWFVTTYIVGLFFLYVLLRAFLRPERIAAWWFAFLAFGLINPWTGLNVTLVRFLLPSVVFLAVGDFLGSGGWRRFWVAAAALAVALTYTFEVAALSILATLILLIVCGADRQVRALREWARGVTLPAEAEQGALPWRREEGEAISRGQLVGRGVGLLTVAGSAALACFYGIDPSGRALRMYPEVALSYSSGAHNMPIYPNLPFLALVAATVFASGVTLRMIAQGGDSGPATLAVAYLPVALVAQRGAFGVSEPSHIAFFGLPTLLLCLFLSAPLRANRAVRMWLAVGLFVGIMFPMHYYHMTQFVPFFSRTAAVSGQAGRTRGPGVGGGTVEATLIDVVRAIGTDHPYVMYELDYYSFPVYRKLGLRYPMYYTMLINSRTHEGMKRVIAEMRDAGAIVAARASDLTSGQEPPRSLGVWEVLDLVTGAHTTGSHLTRVLLMNRARLFAPFLDFVRKEYRPLYEQDGIVALGPKAR